MAVGALKILVGLAVVALIGAIDIHWSGGARRTESEIAARLSNALDAAGLVWVDANVDGQKAILSGAAPDESEMEKAASAALRAAGRGGLVFGAVTTVEADFTLQRPKTPRLKPLNKTPGGARKPPEIALAAPDKPTDDDPTADSLSAGREQERQIRVCQNEVNRLLDETPIRFASSGAAIGSDGRATLDAIARALDQCPDVEIVVGGHSDAAGRSQKNLELSRRRADAVAARLARMMTSGAAIKSVGYGESRPIESNATREGRAQNRRIEITIAALPAEE